jgi:cytochrome c oxidase accessory protein FixG
MEFLFRPLERLIEGGRSQRGRRGSKPTQLRRAAKFLVFFLLAVLVGNLFLSYFVGVSTLWQWVHLSPFQHPSAFLVMGVTSLLVFGDFAYFREQMCTVVCPYARLQSVLLDEKSLIVAYDDRRGEPRGKKGKATGDCVDCGLCVAACPTGIDIRNGLQLECITCTQCIDACDGVMNKIGRPQGLIRYTSLDALAKRSFSLKSLARPRVLIYPAILIALLAGLGIASAARSVAEVSLLRGLGAPFSRVNEQIENHIRIKIRNRTGSAADYSISIAGAPDAKLVAPQNPLRIEGGAQATESVFVLSGEDTFKNGTRDIRVEIRSGTDFERSLPYRLLGPSSRPEAAK